jgi:glycosyltransferase involved in cell wall biosynthesis
MNTDKIFVVMPVYNEEENICETLRRMEREIKYPHIIGIVYDDENDPTIAVIKEFLKTSNPPIVLIKNKYGDGALNAIKTGIESSTQKWTTVMTADLSDEPAVVNDMYEKAQKEDADMVCASRYMKGGGSKNAPFMKGLLSKLAGLSLHLLARVPTHDSTNTFKIYKTSFLRKQTIESSGDGFFIGIELTAKAYCQKAKIYEVPTLWSERVNGQSNFRVWAWLPSYLKWYFYAYRGLFINHKIGVFVFALLIFLIVFLGLF